jgi:predicted Ser/Thr protein kinase
MDADRARIAGIVESARRLPEAERRAYLDGLRLPDADRRAAEAALRAGATVASPGTLGSDAVPLPLTVAGDAPVGMSREEVSRAADPLVGRTFAGVAIERIVGSGGMGRVYLGVDGATGGRVALKVLLRTQHDEAVRRRFEREGRLLERLRHPGIASVLRAGIEADGDVDVPYIVMEYVDGVQNIADHVFRERLGMRETVEQFLQACDAVGHAHREGYVHRDVKPQNVLVDRHGRVKVIDFGVARAIASDPSANTVRTETGQLVGTMQYMSPEQFMADPRLVDARTDVYALGAVLYELLTGVQPHDLRGLPVHEASRTVCETDPADVRQCNPRVDDGLAAIVMDAVSRDPSRRPDDANALANRLRGWMARGTVVDAATRAPAARAEPARPARDAEPARRAAPAPRPGGWGMIALVVVLVAGGVAVGFGLVDLRAVVARARELAPGGPDAPAGPRAADAAAAERALVVVAPRDARIEVDGEPAGTGSVEIAPRADGAARTVVARLEGWGEARASWGGRRDGGLLALNLAPPEGVALLPRVFTLAVGAMPAGSTLSLASPERRALGEGAWAVEVVFGRAAGGAWRDESVELEARRADGTPAVLRAGRASGTGSVKVPLSPGDAGRPLEVRVR